MATIISTSYSKCSSTTSEQYDKLPPNKYRRIIQFNDSSSDSKNHYQQYQQNYYNESTNFSAATIQSHVWSTTIDSKASSSLSSEFLSIQLMLQAAHEKIQEVLSIPFQSHICNLFDNNDHHHEILNEIRKEEFFEGGGDNTPMINFISTLNRIHIILRQTRKLHQKIIHNSKHNIPKQSEFIKTNISSVMRDRQKKSNTTSGYIIHNHNHSNNYSISETHKTVTTPISVHFFKNMKQFHGFLLLLLDSLIESNTVHAPEVNLKKQHDDNISDSVIAIDSSNNVSRNGTKIKKDINVFKSFAIINPIIKCLHEMYCFQWYTQKSRHLQTFYEPEEANKKDSMNDGFNTSSSIPLPSILHLDHEDWNEAYDLLIRLFLRITIPCADSMSDSLLGPTYSSVETPNTAKSFDYNISGCSTSSHCSSTYKTIKSLCSLSTTNASIHSSGSKQIYISKGDEYRQIHIKIVKLLNDILPFVTLTKLSTDTQNRFLLYLLEILFHNKATTYSERNKHGEGLENKDEFFSSKEESFVNLFFLKNVSNNKRLYEMASKALIVIITYDEVCHLNTKQTSTKKAVHDKLLFGRQKQKQINHYLRLQLFTLNCQLIRARDTTDEALNETVTAFCNQIDSEMMQDNDDASLPCALHPLLLRTVLLDNYDPETRQIAMDCLVLVSKLLFCPDDSFRHEKIMIVKHDYILGFLSILTADSVGENYDLLSKAVDGLYHCLYGSLTCNQDLQEHDSGHSRDSSCQTSKKEVHETIRMKQANCLLSNSVCNDSAITRNAISSLVEVIAYGQQRLGRVDDFQKYKHSIIASVRILLDMIKCMSSAILDNYHNIATTIHEKNLIPCCNKVSHMHNDIPLKDLVTVCQYVLDVGLQNHNSYRHHIVCLSVRCLCDYMIDIGTKISAEFAMLFEIDTILNSLTRVLERQPNDITVYITDTILYLVSIANSNMPANFAACTWPSICIGHFDLIAGITKEASLIESNEQGSIGNHCNNIPMRRTKAIAILHFLAKDIYNLKILANHRNVLSSMVRFIQTYDHTVDGREHLDSNVINPLEIRLTQVDKTVTIHRDEFRDQIFQLAKLL